MYDMLMEALANEQRRRLLLHLLETDPQLDFPPLDEDRQRSPEEARREQIALYHNHLPMLEGAGFIDWDEEAGEVTKGPAFEDLEPLLQFLRDDWDEVTAPSPEAQDGRQTSDQES